MNPARQFSQYEHDQSELERLRAENQRLESELQDMLWAKKKTNDGIRILYKDLEKKNEALKTLDQLKSKFLAVVSHELRTPITIVLQTVENIASGAFGPVSDKQKMWLKRVEENAGKLGGLVTDILDFSRLQAGVYQLKREPVDVGRIAAATVENMTGLAEQKGLKLTSNISTQAPKAWGNAARIEQVIMNLITNALKFTPSGGHIEVSVGMRSNACQVVVSDTGPGIPEKSRQTIFDPFVQITEDQGKAPLSSGVGLGLAICKEIIEQHQGEIWVESDFEKGSRFCFSIPIDPRMGGDHA